MTTATPASPATTASAIADHDSRRIRYASPGHLQAVARVGHALSDPTRAAIVLALRHGTCCPADLAAALDVSRQSMSNHLACLRGCGLVIAERRGRHSHYSLADGSLAHGLDALLSVTVTLDPTCCSGGQCSC